jgi:hypothetical protein
MAFCPQPVVSPPDLPSDQGMADDVATDTQDEGGCAARPELRGIPKPDPVAASPAKGVEGPRETGDETEPVVAIPLWADGTDDENGAVTSAKAVAVSVVEDAVKRLVAVDRGAVSDAVAEISGVMKPTQIPEDEYEIPGLYMQGDPNRNDHAEADFANPPHTRPDHIAQPERNEVEPFGQGVGQDREGSNAMSAGLGDHLAAAGDISAVIAPYSAGETAVSPSRHTIRHDLAKFGGAEVPATDFSGQAIWTPDNDGSPKGGDDLASNTVLANLAGLHGGPDTPAHAPKTTHAPTPMPTEIGRQLAASLSDLTGQSVDVTLSPEELGRVRMTISSADGVLTLTLVAERSDTLDLMRRNVDQLARDFRDLGFSTLNFAFSQDGKRPQTAQIIFPPERQPEMRDADFFRPAPSLPSKVMVVGSDDALDLRM